MLILLTNTKGGVGKSTLAAHLAVYLFDVGARVALLDADEQRSSSQWLTEAEPAIQTRVATKPDEIVEAVRDLSEATTYVVADAPGRIESESRTLMLLADLAVFPITPSLLDLRSVAQAVEILHEARTINDGKPDALLLLNRVRKRDRISRELREAAPALGFSVCKRSVRDLQAFRNAAQQGTVVTRMGRKSRQAARDLDHVFHEILLPMNIMVANE